MRLAALGAALAALTAAAAAHAAAPVFAKCPENALAQCTTVVVPLDRSGAVAGTVSLHVERLLPAGPPVGALFLVAGGPGEAATGVFGADDLAIFQSMFPGYALVLFDARGTGRSGLLRCPSIEGAVESDTVATARAVAACAAELGPAAGLYSTRDQAEDVEAVRAALGIGRIALYGVSYGTLTAQVYAALHPDRVERLLLDSTLPPTGLDPFGRNSLAALPAALDGLCAGGCPRGIRPGDDAVALAERLAAQPLRGPVLDGLGGRRTVTLTAQAFLRMLVGSDIAPELFTTVPGAVRAALDGDPAVLLRLADALGRLRPAERLLDLENPTVQLVTDCSDGPAPWQAATALDGRLADRDAAAAGLPAGSSARFGPWALNADLLGVPGSCASWPAAPAPLPVVSGLDVPVLVVAGDLDVRTPVANATAVAAGFPHAAVLVVHGVGHAVLAQGAPACVAAAVRAWVAGSTPATACDGVHDALGVLPALPRDPSRLRPLALGGVRGRTLRALALTVRDAATAAGLALADSGLRLPATAGGLRAGSLTVRVGELDLHGYSVFDGVAVSGTAAFGADGDAGGRLAVGGPRASAGTVTLTDLRGGRTRMTGTLGGRPFDVVV